VTEPRLLALADRWEPKRGSLLVIGPAGIGKTTIAALICRRLVHAGDFGVRWTSGIVQARARREARFGEQNRETIRVQNAPLLVIDELGQEDTDARWLLELIDGRYTSGRACLTTSGLTRPQLETRYGVGAVRRLIEPVGACLDLFGRDRG
jgi:DNA replication protein DnaC